MSDYVELTEEEIDEYLSVAFSNADRVGPKARHQLHGLLKYYAKKRHPFTACVRDNTKRFGPGRAKRVCAVLKDIIRGTTKWRGKHNPKDKGVSPAALAEEFALNLSEEDQHELDEFLEDMEIPEDKEELDLAAGDVAWDYTGGEEYLREMLNNALNGTPNGSAEIASDYSMTYWVRDTNEKDSTALVCQGGDTYWVVPYKMDKKGNLEVSDESDWKHVQQSWVETNLADEPQLMAEMFFDDEETEISEEENLIWKPVLREGKWEYSPGPNQVPLEKPITVNRDGKSDGRTRVISIEEIKNNFDAGVMEHVTIPETHADKVTENTGFVRKLRIGEDQKGRATLEAAFDFTEPEVKNKVKRGTIANTSAGILFDYINKEKGNKYNAVMAHAALTNHPWLNGMKPFGVTASDNLQVVAFSEENQSPNSIGGERMSQATEEKETQNEEKTDLKNALLEKLGLSEDEVEARLREYDSLKENEKQHSVESKIKKWQEEGVLPAVLAEAKPILMADDGAVALHLSEDGRDKPLTATEVVERIIGSIPKVDLTDDPSNKDQGASDGGRPDDDTKEENELADLSLSERTEAASLVLSRSMSEEDAVKEVRSKREKKE